MPIIRRGGGAIGSAGQAAAAFDQTRQPQRNNELRVAQTQARLQQVLEQAKIQEGFRAEERDYRRSRDEQEYQLRERRVANQEAATWRRRLGSDAPISGQSMIAMGTRLEQLDRGAYEQFEQQFDAMTGGQFGPDNPLTPEKLEALPNRNAIYAALSEVYAPVSAQADAGAIQRTGQEFGEAFMALDKEFAQSTEGQRIALDLAERLNGRNVTPAQAESLAAQAMNEAAMKVGLKRDRQTYASRIEDLIDEHNVTGDQRAQLRDMAARTLRVQDPQNNYLRAKAIVDPEARLLAEMGFADGQKQGSLGASVAQVRQSLQSAAGSAPSRAQASNAPAGALSYDTDRDIIEGMRDTSGADPEFEAFLSKTGINPTSQDAVLSAAEEFIRQRRKRKKRLDEVEALPPREQSRASFFRG